MTMTSTFNSKTTRKIFKSYENGDSNGKICFAFDLSEHTLRNILNKYPSLKKQAKKKRIVNKKKTKNKLIKKLRTNKVSISIKKTRPLTPEEKVIELERKLKNEQKKNQELQGLLNVAKDVLGKL